MIAVQHEGRRRFLELVADLRPELHRYCARMTGSAADGEDIVQEAPASAYNLLTEMNQMPAFRPPYSSKTARRLSILSLSALGLICIASLIYDPSTPEHQITGSWIKFVIGVPID